MNRETTNKIRFVLEELLPPILRDSFLFRWLFRAHWGDRIDKLEKFRRDAPFITDEDYKAVYEDHPRVHDETDNSKACLEAVLNNIVGNSVLDVGCGTGHLLRHLDRYKPGLELSGVDIIAPDTGDEDKISFHQAVVERLPFPDASFDTVICTHTLEHILDIRAAIKELRRVRRRRLILVVPKEREYLFTFNPHFHFFPYSHSFLRVLIPVPPAHKCELLGRDIFYLEDG